MQITRLEIMNLRIVEKAILSPSAGINLIAGDNGAGKTTLLEGIYLAGRGRTFRHVDAGPMIRQGTEQATVVVTLRDESTGQASILGVRRGRRGVECRLNGENVDKRSKLAEALPIQWVGSQPQLLLERGPEIRRRFMDMAVFHVEHAYVRILNEFQRVLRQRNAAIRAGCGAREIQLWDRPLAVAGDLVHGQRETLLKQLMPRLFEQLSAWAPGFVLDYRYRPGWRNDRPYFDQLSVRTEADRRVGYTSLGPQRAELELLVEGVPAKKVLSRGQQKLLVLALNLALIDAVIDSTLRPPVILIDDLAAELDPGNRRKVMDALIRRPVQVFVTAIESRALKIPPGSSTMFHVEQGALSTCSEV